MASTYLDEFVLNFDLNQLSNEENIRAQTKDQKYEKLRKYTSWLKSRIISTDFAIQKYQNKKDDHEQSVKAHSVTREELKQACINYQEALEKCKILEQENKVLLSNQDVLNERIREIETKYDALLSHTNQVQVLLKQLENEKDALIVERELDKCNKKDGVTELIELQQEKDNMLKDILAFKNVILGKKKISKRHVRLMKKYVKDTKSKGSKILCTSEESDDDMETYGDISSAIVHNTNDKELIDNYSDGDISVDTGRGSSRANSHDKCLSSPDYVISLETLLKLPPKDTIKQIDACNSPILIYPPRSVATSPIIFEDSPVVFENQDEYIDHTDCFDDHEYADDDDIPLTEEIDILVAQEKFVDCDSPEQELCFNDMETPVITNNKYIILKECPNGPAGTLLCRVSDEFDPEAVIEKPIPNYLCDNSDFVVVNDMKKFVDACTSPVLITPDLSKFVDLGTNTDDTGNVFENQILRMCDKFTSIDPEILSEKKQYVNACTSPISKSNNIYECIDASVNTDNVVDYDNQSSNVFEKAAKSIKLVDASTSTVLTSIEKPKTIDKTIDIVSHKQKGKSKKSLFNDPEAIPVINEPSQKCSNSTEKLRTREKVCLESNSSKNLHFESTYDNEVQDILNVMKLHHDLISPISNVSDPSDSHYLKLIPEMNNTLTKIWDTLANIYKIPKQIRKNVHSSDSIEIGDKEVIPEAEINNSVPVLNSNQRKIAIVTEPIQAEDDIMETTDNRNMDTSITPTGDTCLTSPNMPNNDNPSDKKSKSKSDTFINNILPDSRTDITVLRSKQNEKHSEQQQAVNNIKLNKNDIDNSHFIEEINEETDLRQEFLADQQESLEDQQESLEDQQESLEDQQESLEDQQTSLVDQQASLINQQASLEDQQAPLENQQKSLVDQQEFLADQPELHNISEEITKNDNKNDKCSVGEVPRAHTIMIHGIKNKNKSKLEKFRKKLLPICKIKRMSPPIFKHKQKIHNLKNNDTSLNQKLAYENAVKVMTELRSNQELKDKKRILKPLTDDTEIVSKATQIELSHEIDEPRILSTRSRTRKISKREDDNVKTVNAEDVKDIVTSPVKRKNRKRSADTEVDTLQNCKRFLRSSNVPQVINETDSTDSPMEQHNLLNENSKHRGLINIDKDVRNSDGSLREGKNNGNCIDTFNMNNNSSPKTKLAEAKSDIKLDKSKLRRKPVVELSKCLEDNANLVTIIPGNMDYLDVNKNINQTKKSTVEVNGHTIEDQVNHSDINELDSENNVLKNLRKYSNINNAKKRDVNDSNTTLNEASAAVIKIIDRDFPKITECSFNKSTNKSEDKRYKNNSKVSKEKDLHLQRNAAINLGMRKPIVKLIPLENDSNCNKNNVISYGDLDLFTMGVDEEGGVPNIPSDSEKPSKKTENILCKALDRYGVISVKYNHKKVSDAITLKISQKIEEGISNIIAAPKCEQKIRMNELVSNLQVNCVKSILAGLMKYLKEPTRKTELYNKIANGAAPPMTRAEMILLYVIENLDKAFPGFINRVWNSMEHALFQLNRSPGFDVIESMSHFYAVLCRYFRNKSRLRCFMLDAMYCLQFKAVPLIRQCLDVCPGVLPSAHEHMAKTSLVTCLVYLLHFYKCKDKFSRAQGLRDILNRKYRYQFSEWNETMILEIFRKAIMDLRGTHNDKKMLRVALIILCKRHGAKWCQLNILQNILLPIIEQKDAPQRIKQFCVLMLGPLLKPFPADRKAQCEIVINQLLQMLKLNPADEMKEAVYSSLIFMNKHDQDRVVQSLLLWNPERVSPEFEEILNDYVMGKPLAIWKKLVLRTSSQCS